MVHVSCLSSSFLKEKNSVFSNLPAGDRTKKKNKKKNLLFRAHFAFNDPLSVGPLASTVYREREAQLRIRFQFLHLDTQEKIKKKKTQEFCRLL